MTAAFPQRLPAAPLARMVDQLVARSRLSQEEVCDRLSLSPSVLSEWRTQSGRRVDPSTADRVVTASPYLWWDIWSACDRGPQHDHDLAEHDRCEICDAHIIAQYVFTGVRPARRRRRPPGRPRATARVA